MARPALRSRTAYDSAVADLRAQLAALPPGAPVRLGKATSNLFRTRATTSAPRLDVSAFTGVLEVDVTGRTADVLAMTTYEELVDATLPLGLMPLVVPQLKTITLGGAVTGLGIESSSFRNGTPHESVLDLDVLTGDGRVLHVTPDGEHADLFAGFPNSYGTLGYALRLRIELEPVSPYVHLRHVECRSAAEAAHLMAEVCAQRSADFVDGTWFSPTDVRVTLGTWRDAAPQVSDYTGRHVYYRSLQERDEDWLTVRDYLWRWDTDWFWCSRAFGAQHPVVRRLWPRRLRRSDVYWRLVALDRRFGVGERLDRRAGRPQGERVVQDVEVPVGRLPEFLAWFDAEVGMRPVWLCPLRLRRTGAERPWPTYPLASGTTYVNVGFWGNVAVGPDAPRSPRNRAVEAKVAELGGHKSLYSEAFYTRADFDRLYDGANLARVRAVHDPDGRMTDLFDKVVGRR